MEAIVVILVVVLVGIVAALMFDRLRGERTNVSQAVESAQQRLEQRIEGLDQRLTQGLGTVQQTLTHSLTATQETIQNIGQQLGRLESSSKQMLEIGQDISGLQDILRPPKLRGGFGELLLENLLCQVVPQNHEMQHCFRSGERVDAVVRLGGGMVPVDSKFPMESFNRMLAATSEEERAPLRRAFLRDVKGHIDAVAKYIQPDEGTLEFALMYIPAEGVYYETFFRDERSDGGDSAWTYAMSRRVIPVSPNSFYAYLQAIALGLKGMRVEERAREIMSHLARLDREFELFRGEFETLGTHIGRAKTKYDEVDKRVGRLGDRLFLPLHEEREKLPPTE